MNPMINKNILFHLLSILFLLFSCETFLTIEEVDIHPDCPKFTEVTYDPCSNLIEIKGSGFITNRDVYQIYISEADIDEPIPIFTPQSAHSSSLILIDNIPPNTINASTQMLNLSYVRPCGSGQTKELQFEPIETDIILQISAVAFADVATNPCNPSLKVDGTFCPNRKDIYQLSITDKNNQTHSFLESEYSITESFMEISIPAGFSTAVFDLTIGIKSPFSQKTQEVTLKPKMPFLQANLLGLGCACSDSKIVFGGTFCPGQLDRYQVTFHDLENPEQSMEGVIANVKPNLLEVYVPVGAPDGVVRINYKDFEQIGGIIEHPFNYLLKVIDTKAISGFQQPAGLALQVVNTNETNLYVVDQKDPTTEEFDRIGLIQNDQLIEPNFAGKKPPSPNLTFNSSDTPKNGATFNSPIDLVVDANNAIFISDNSNKQIRRISGNEVANYAGKIQGNVDCLIQEDQGSCDIVLCDPRALALDDEGILYFTGLGGIIRAVHPPISTTGFCDYNQRIARDNFIIFNKETTISLVGQLPINETASGLEVYNNQLIIASDKAESIFIGQPTDGKVTTFDTLFNSTSTVRPYDLKLDNEAIVFFTDYNSQKSRIGYFPLNKPNQVEYIGEPGNCPCEESVDLSLQNATNIELYQVEDQRIIYISQRGKDFVLKAILQ